MNTKINKSQKNKDIDTRTEILNVSLDLFAEQSYHKITVKDIQKEAGISTGGLFYHFNSKFEIAQEALYKWMDDAYKPFYKKIEKKPHPEKMLKTIIDFSIDLFIEKPKMMRFFLEVYELEIQNEKKSSKMVRIFDRFISSIQVLMESYNIPNSTYKAHMLVACLDGLMFQYIFSKGSKEWLNLDILKEEMYEMFVRNLKSTK